MSETMDEEFLHELQRALQHLYDPVELHKSPLIALLGLEKQANPASALQKVLVDAVLALKPGRDVPLHANAWRNFHILTFQYIEQSPQATVANNLALSVRQLRRLQRTAEEALCDYLREQYKLAEKTGKFPSAGMPAREQELEWLIETFPNEVGGLVELVDTVLRTAAPLIQSAGVQVTCDIQEGLPPLSGQLVALRQALLNVLTASIATSVTGRVSLSACLVGQEIELQLGPGQPGEAATIAEVSERLQMARQFIKVFGGKLEYTPGQPTRLMLPVANLLPVLIIDDNADTLRLFQRYMAGTRYQFSSASDPFQVLAVAADLAPRAIVMDILLPGMEGWELLGRLRTHPKTHAIPIIACTIMPEEELALALGAAAFLRKPVSREALLQALDQLVSPPAQK